MNSDNQQAKANTQKCIFCDEEIQADAIKCKICSCVIPNFKNVPDLMFAAKTLINKERYVQAESLLTKALNMEANKPARLRIFDELARCSWGRKNKEETDRTYQAAMAVIKEKNTGISKELAQTVRQNYINFLKEAGLTAKANKLIELDRWKSIQNALAWILAAVIVIGIGLVVILHR
jgi:hypothetical protein